MLMSCGWKETGVEAEMGDETRRRVIRAGCEAARGEKDEHETPAKARADDAPSTAVGRRSWRDVASGECTVGGEERHAWFKIRAKGMAISCAGQVKDRGV